MLLEVWLLLLIAELNLWLKLLNLLLVLLLLWLQLLVLLIEGNNLIFQSLAYLNKILITNFRSFNQGIKIYRLQICMISWATELPRTHGPRLQKPRTKTNQNVSKNLWKTHTQLLFDPGFAGLASEHHFRFATWNLRYLNLAAKQNARDGGDESEEV